MNRRRGAIGTNSTSFAYPSGGAGHWDFVWYANHLFSEKMLFFVLHQAVDGVMDDSADRVHDRNDFGEVLCRRSRNLSKK